MNRKPEAQDRGLVQRIHDWVQRVMKDIREMLFIPEKGKTANTKSGSVRTNTSVAANGSLSLVKILQEILDVKKQIDIVSPANP